MKTIEGVTKDYVSTVLETMGLSRDIIVRALNLHRGEIVEADEWRPLADHVAGLMAMAYGTGYVAAKGEVADGILRGAEEDEDEEG